MARGNKLIFIDESKYRKVEDEEKIFLILESSEVKLLRKVLQSIQQDCEKDHVKLICQTDVYRQHMLF